MSLKRALTVTVFLVAQSALAAPVVHDCRIKSVSISVQKPPFPDIPDGDGIRMTAIYRGMDGRPLTRKSCPDMFWPTWGADFTVFCSDDGMNCDVVVAGPDPGEYLVTVDIFQNPDRVIHGERTVTIP